LKRGESKDYKKSFVAVEVTRRVLISDLRLRILVGRLILPSSDFGATAAGALTAKFPVPY
jgi:hypothetical protein